MANPSSTWAKTARFLHVIPPPFSQQIVAKILTNAGLSMSTSLVICHQRSQHIGCAGLVDTLNCWNQLDHWRMDSSLNDASVQTLNILKTLYKNRHTHTNNERNLPSSQELFQYLLVEMCSPFPLASNVATHQFTFLEVVGSSWLWSVLGLLCSAQTQYRKDWICMKMVISPNTKLICTDFKEVWSQQSHGAGCIWHGWLFTDVWHGQDRINHLSHSNSRYNSSYRHYSCCNSYSGCGNYGGSSCHSFDATLWLLWQAWQAQLWAWAFW